MPAIPKISMMTTLGVNVGDEFIREGIISFLEDILPRFRLFYVNKHDLASLHETRMDEVDILEDKFRDADVIIQAGAPVYWKLENGSTCYNVDWAEALWYERIFKLGSSKIILNLGAGSCLPFSDSGASVTDDLQCVEFIRSVSASCRWVSVRDPIAANILQTLHLPAESLACPAFHAARRCNINQKWGDVVGINLMPLSGHYAISPDITEESSRVLQTELVNHLRRHHQLLFIAHTPAEAEYIEGFKSSGENIFYSPNFRDYLSVYAGCRAVIANRVHGAVCAAGFGVPAVIIGNDSRLRIGDFIGLPSFYAGNVQAREILESFEGLIQNEQNERSRLRELRNTSTNAYVQHLSAKLSRFL